MNEIDKQCPDFEVFEHALAAAGTPYSASYIHGMVVARLCMGSSEQVAWAELQNELPFLKPDEQAYKLFSSLFKWTVQELAALDSLTMMLPTDEEPLTDRLCALADWCAGFVNVMDETQASRSPILAEVLQDFSLVKDVIQDEGELEEQERDFTEILEFVRVGALLAHAECSPSPGKQPQTLH